MRKNSIKNVRINSEVQRALSSIIRNEVKDYRLDGMVSVTDVYVAPDLKTCKAHISVLGDAEKLALTIEGLTRAEGRCPKAGKLRKLAPKSGLLINLGMENRT